MPEGKHLQALKRKGWEIVHVEDDRYFVLQLAQEVLVFDTKRDIPLTISTVECLYKGFVYQYLKKMQKKNATGSVEAAATKESVVAPTEDTNLQAAGGAAPVTEKAVAALTEYLRLQLAEVSSSSAAEDEEDGSSSDGADDGADGGAAGGGDVAAAEKSAAARAAGPNLQSAGKSKKELKNKREKKRRRRREIEQSALGLYTAEQVKKRKQRRKTQNAKKHNRDKNKNKKKGGKK